MEKNNKYLLKLLNAKNFLNGQLALYKIEFIKTDNNKYLQVMNELNSTLETITRMDDLIQRILKENKELKKTNKKF